jgi:hypothetical protein
VAEAVVDGLEVVEVDAQHGGPRRCRRRCDQRLADTLAVQGAVAESRQRIVRGVVLEPSTARLQLLRHDREP